MSTEKNKTLSKKNEKKVKKAKRVAVRTASKTKLRTVSKKGAAKKASGSARLKNKPEGHSPQSARITPPKGVVQAEAAKTKFFAKDEDKRNWLLVDASGQTVGRLASQIAMVLRGKNKATYTPNNDVGDFVVVINAEKIRFTKDKESKKSYYRHTGFPGGIKETAATRMKETKPERILEFAVKGMVPRSPLGRKQMTKLKIYKGTEHPHAAQNPQVWEPRYNSAAK
jgi:large subunit ribosomal protein L13